MMNFKKTGVIAIAQLNPLKKKELKLKKKEIRRKEIEK